MKSPLERLEASFKELFEGKSSIQEWTKDQPAAIRSLLLEIDRFLASSSSHSDTLSCQFVYYVNQDDFLVYGSESDMESMVSKVMNTLAAGHGISFPQNPTVKFVIKRSLLPGQVEIKSVRTKNQTDGTGSYTAHTSPAQSPEAETVEKAALLLADETIIYLSGPVTNLGRKSNNHIIFDDLRISRNHAQIRHIYEDYVLFDTGSSGGTFVNGERINQWKLKPGDVISLAGVKLIFSLEGPSMEVAESEITSEIGPALKGK
jgi:hypothetical protein